MESTRKIIKAFREFLNQKYGFTDKRWAPGSRGNYGAQKRLYGDYLYNQDRVMFDECLRLALEGTQDGEFLETLNSVGRKRG